jgi:diguanylate cyclase (GGDEF)-like protein
LAGKGAALGAIWLVLTIIAICDKAKSAIGARMAKTPMTKAAIVALLDQAWAKRFEQLETSRADFQTAKANAEAIGDSLLYAQALLGIGATASTQGQYQTAFDCYQEALELFKAANDHNWQAATLNRIGIVFGSYGDLESALSYYSQAAEMTTNIAHRLEYQSNFAIIRGNLGDWHQALALQREIVAAGHAVFSEEELLKAKSNVVMYLFHIVSALKKQGSEEEAEIYLPELLDLSLLLLQKIPNHGHYRLRSEMYQMLAEVEQLQGNNELAKTYILQSLEIVQGMKQFFLEMINFYFLGRLERGLGNHQAALAALDRAQAIAETISAKGFLAQIHEEFTATYEIIGNYQAALKHHRLFHQLDSAKKSEAALRRAEALAAQMRLQNAQLETQLQRERAEALAQLNTILAEQARTDALTGVANRRFLNESLHQHFDAARRSDKALSVVIIDLDHFKQINDQYSHATGDEVLRIVGGLLRQHCRSGDVVARYGGEEFALLLDGQRNDDTLNACERLRHSIEQYDWATIHTGLKVTASIGFCDDTSVGNPEKMLSKADEALYTAKNNGRNRIERACEAITPP